MKELDQITRKEFKAYEAVRRSGVVNMWSSDVQDLAGIDKETHTGIIKHYTELMRKFPGVRK